MRYYFASRATPLRRGSVRPTEMSSLVTRMGLTMKTVRFAMIVLFLISCAPKQLASILGQKIKCEEIGWRFIEKKRAELARFGKIDGPDIFFAYNPQRDTCICRYQYVSAGTVDWIYDSLTNEPLASHQVLPNEKPTAEDEAFEK